MVKSYIKNVIEHKLSAADIQINGKRPWDIQVHNESFYEEIATRGSIALGESYMQGWIDVKQLDESIKRILEARLEQAYSSKWLSGVQTIGSILLNNQSKKRARIVGEKHYDLGNDLFECMLDKRMTYSCAYWKQARNLDEAQEAKLELICQKLYLKPGMKVLDIGCGWGSFAKYAAEKHGVHVVGITISQKQLELAQERCQGLPIELRFQDYRDINEKFDRIVSIGQMEHVGYKNYRLYMQIAARSLHEDGLFLLHTIGSNSSNKLGDPWINKYIFPHGMLPSAAQLCQASEGLFILEDWHNFGPDYDKTLMAWYNNFTKHWDKLKERYGQPFYRMWTYYLLSCAGAFRARYNQLWQIVYSKKGVLGGYVSLR